MIILLMMKRTREIQSISFSVQNIALPAKLNVTASWINTATVSCTVTLTSEHTFPCYAFYLPATSAALPWTAQWYETVEKEFKQCNKRSPNDAQEMGVVLTVSDVLAKYEQTGKIAELLPAEETFALASMIAKKDALINELARDYQAKIAVLQTQLKAVNS